MRESRDESTVREVGHGLLVLLGAALLILASFLVLPLMETISQGPQNDLIVQDVDTAALPPPPPPPPPEPEPEQPDEPEPPPELQEQPQPLDLAQLEMALNPGGFGDGLVGDFAVRLTPAAGGAAAATEELFSLADLDQKPRVVHTVDPTMDAAVRRRAPGTVTILFLVDQDGRVENPIVHSATDPIFEKPALAAIRQWKFEPGRRQGKPVRFRMKVPITFPAGR